MALRRVQNWGSMTAERESLRTWLAAVTAISRSVNAATPLDAIVNDIARQGRRLIGFDSCAILLIDPPGDVMKIVGSSGLLPRYLDLVGSEQSLHLYPVGATAQLPVARAYHDGRTITVPDVTNSEYARLVEFSLAQGYRSLLAAPLRDGEKIIGMLIGYFSAPHGFEAAEIELAELLAEQTATAVQAARLRESRVVTITELSIANAELRERRSRLEWADQQHRRLMQLVLDNIGLSGLVAALADLLGASVTVQDASQKTLASAHGADAYLAPPKIDRRRRDDRARPLRYEAKRVGDQPQPTWLTPVILGGEVVGRLWVIGTSEAPDAGQLHLIERFALVAGWEILKQRHLVEVQERLSADLLVDLLRTDGVVRPEVLVQRAAALRLDLTAPHWVAVGTADAALSLATAQSSTRGLLDSAKAFAGIYDSSIVILIAADHDPVALLRRFQRHLQEHLHDTRVVMALSPLAEHIDDYAINFQIAMKSARLRAGAGSEGLIDLREISLTTLILAMGAVPNQLRALSDKLVRPLAVHDERRGGDLVITLRMWLDFAYSVTKAADALNLHVNTVSYRLTKIQQLIRRDLRLASTRVELALALHVWDVIGLGENPEDSKNEMS